MKTFRYILLLIFVFSCNSKNASQNKQQINQNKKQAEQVQKIKMQKRIPAHNRTMINKINNQNIEETLKRIDDLEREEVAKATQSYRGLEGAKPSSLNYSDTKAKGTQEVKEPQSKKVIEDDFVPNPKVASAPKQDFAPKQTISPQNPYQGQNDKPQILEISGMQNKQKQYSFEQKPMFILSTSPSYKAEDLESVSSILRQFGDVQFQKMGDTFSLKIHPKKPLTTQTQADELLKEIIRYPFFDIYVEELK